MERLLGRINWESRRVWIGLLWVMGDSFLFFFFFSLEVLKTRQDYGHFEFLFLSPICGFKWKSSFRKTLLLSFSLFPKEKKKRKKTQWYINVLKRYQNRCIDLVTYFRVKCCPLEGNVAIKVCNLHYSNTLMCVRTEHH
jgi:hypothetical protein